MTAAVLTVSALALSACNAVTASDGTSSTAESSDGATTATPAVDMSVNVAKAKKVAVDTVVKAHASDGSLRNVQVFYGKKPSKDTRVDGTMSKDNSGWTADDLLEPGKTYHVVTRGENADGESRSTTTRFSTEDLTLDQQTFPSVFPLQGQTVGVAIPIIVRFDLPVHRKAAVEKRLSVTSDADVPGSWSWVSDTEVRYRPKKFWPGGTKVHVSADVNSVSVGNGIYGQESRDVKFTIGKSQVSTVDVTGHTLTVRSDGKVLRTLPATTGKPGFETRAGTKVIMEKYLSKRMDAATTGVSTSSPDYYNIGNVQYAMRVTNSGEFIHAAPWSVGSQGSANVSHGCVGLSTANAQWLYSITQIGDPVKFIHSSRPLEQGNGWTDWDESYQDFKDGSALS